MINSFSSDSRGIVVDALNHLFSDRQREVVWAARQATRRPDFLFYQKLEIEARGELAKVDNVMKELGMVSRLRRFSYDKDRRIHEY